MPRSELDRRPSYYVRTGLAVLALASALAAPGSVGGHEPVVPPRPVPQAVQPFPEERSTGHADVNGLTRVRRTTALVTNNTSLGQPVAASIELRKGKRTGYALDSRGKVIAKRTVSLATSMAASATRYFRVGGSHYYLLDWGPLAGWWAKLDGSVTLLPTRPWKVALLVMHNTNLDYVDAIGGVHHLEASMSVEHRDLMVDAALTTPALATDWSSGLVGQQLTVVDVEAPLTQLSDLGGGMYWLGPWDLGSTLDEYVGQYEYDSVIAVWQPWDAEDEVPSWGWGLSIAPGPWTYGAGWSTLTVPPAGAEWWISDQAYAGEPYIHEWLHHVTDYYRTKGALVPDLHNNDYYGYAVEGNTWRRWYSDLMREHLLDPVTDQYSGLDYLAWNIGTPSTNP